VKISVYFQDKTLGTISAQGDGDLTYDGPAVNGLKERANWFAETTGLKGEALLDHMLMHLNGYTWAAKVKENWFAASSSPSTPETDPLEAFDAKLNDEAIE
jgi:hypothetical protein